jgi:putative hemolysin
MIVEIVVILMFILLNGAFAMTELAVVSARRTRLQQAAERGEKGADTALSLQGEPTRFLSTVQIGMTLIGVLTGAYGGATLAEPLAAWLADKPVVGPYAGSLALAVVVFAIGFLTLILGELVPKRIGMTRPEAIAIAAAPIMRPLMRATAPAAWALSHATDLVLRAIRLKPSSPDAEADEEIKLLMREGTETGAFHATERSIVEQTLRLDDRRVSTLMTPRPQIEALDLSDPLEVNREKLVGSGYSRFPVIEGDWRHVVGILLLRDFAAPALHGEAVDLRALVKPALYIPENATALQAVETFKREGAPLALIIDEYGDIEGLVTLNDLLQALVGDIADPTDVEDAPSMVRREDGSFLVDGMMPIDDLFERLSLPHPEAVEDRAYDTLGGFVMARLGRIPAPADHFMVDQFRFEVVDMDGRRVDKVLVVPPGDG